MTPEGKVKAKIDLLLKYVSAWYFKPVSNGLGTHGIPDFVGCYQGRFFTIEAKSATGKPTALQMAQKEKIERAGGKWFLVCDDDTLKEVHKWFGQVSEGF